MSSQSSRIVVTPLMVFYGLFAMAGLVVPFLARRFADHWLVRVLGEWRSEPNPASDTDRLILFKDV